MPPTLEINADNKTRCVKDTNKVVIKWQKSSKQTEDSTAVLQTRQMLVTK